MINPDLSSIMIMMFITDAKRKIRAFRLGVEV